MKEKEESAPAEGKVSRGSSAANTWAASRPLPLALLESRVTVPIGLSRGAHSPFLLKETGQQCQRAQLALPGAGFSKLMLFLWCHPVQSTARFTPPPWTPRPPDLCDRSHQPRPRRELRGPLWPAGRGSSGRSCRAAIASAEKRPSPGEHRAHGR